MNTKEFKKSTWLITAKTNLHVGDESSTGYGLIDKSVQRDALMKLPCINSSSLKGALNEYCIGSTDLSGPDRVGIFGADKKGEDKDVKKGTTLFFDAHILFLPIQDDQTLYRYVTGQSVIKYLQEQVALFSAGIEIKETTENEKKCCEINSIKAEVLSDESFSQFCSDDELPIIARNVLENGESKNLWYEQILPPETVFYTFIQSPDGVLEETLDGKIVQIGANATIGYGYCKLTKIC